MAGKALFISHASHDADAVARIVDYLEDAGVACWISSRDIPPRAVYAEAIADGIKATQACAVILSNAANASAAVKREVELASRHNKPFIPILIEAVELGSGLDYYLHNIQWMDFHRDGTSALDRITETMNAPPGAAPASTASASRGRSTGGARPSLIALGVTLAALLAIGSIWVARGGLSGSATPQVVQPAQSANVNPTTPTVSPTSIAAAPAPAQPRAANLMSQVQARYQTVDAPSRAVADEVAASLERRARLVSIPGAPTPIDLVVNLQGAYTNHAAGRFRANADVIVTMRASATECRFSLNASDDTLGSIGQDFSAEILERLQPMLEGAGSC
jgi:TIR domain